MTSDSSSMLGERRSPMEGRTIYLLPVDAMPPESSAGVLLGDLLKVIWKRKWFVAGVTVASAVIAVAYALLATEWYRAETVLRPVKSSEGLAAQLGNFAGLARIAGISIGDGGDSAEALAVLESRELMRAFIEEQNLVPILFARRWDAKLGRWKSNNPDTQPDVRDAIRYFDRSILRIVQEKKTGLVTLSVEWTDPVIAASWANLLVERANERMRERASREASANVKFLQEELKGTNLVALQQSISRVIENEYQILMLARGNKEFAFRVIDRATVPKWRSRPKRTMLVAMALIGGFVLAVVAVIGRSALQGRRSPAHDGVMSSAFE